MLYFRPKHDLPFFFLPCLSEEQYSCLLSVLWLLVEGKLVVWCLDLPKSKLCEIYLHVLFEMTRHGKREVISYAAVSASTGRQLKDNVVIGHGQHRFTRGRSCLTNLISFYDKVTHLIY